MLKKAAELASMLVMGVAMVVAIKLFGIDPDDVEWE